MTVFGEVTVTRMAYRAPGAANLHPADAELNLSEEKHSHGMRKLATRLSPGEKHSRKRMAELAAVYDAVPAPRSPADIIRLPGQEMPARRPGPAAKGKWLTASVTDDIAAGFDEAGRRDPGHQRTWVALVDGNATQREAITAEAKRRHVTALAQG